MITLVSCLIEEHFHVQTTAICSKTVRFKSVYLSLIFFFLLFISINNVIGQSIGDYRSNTATMTWNTAASWQTWNGSSWVAATSYPGQNIGTGTVTIQSGHNVTLNISPVNTFTNLTIQGTSAILTVGGTYTLKTPYVLITSSGSMVWSGNFTLSFPANMVLDVVSPGNLSTSPCNANHKIQIGAAVYATCPGGGGQYSFADINGSGGSIKVTASSNSPICQGATLNLLAVASGLGSATATYSWTGSGPSGYTFSASTSNPSISGLVPGTYSFTATAIDGSYSNSKTISVTVVPTVGTPTTPTPSATTICQASAPTAYTTSATNATDYTWSVTGAGNSMSGTGVTSTVTWASNFTGAATISVVANGCNGPSSVASTTVNVTPTVSTPAFSLGSSSTRCMGAETVTYTSIANNNTGITYTLDATTLAFSGNSIVNSTGAVTYAAGWSGSSTITATATGCNGPSIATHTVTTAAGLGSVSTPSGSISICQGSAPTNYTASAANATNYTWSVSGVGNSISGTSTTGTVAWAAGFSGSATISVIANGCGGATSGPNPSVVTVNALPTATISTPSPTAPIGSNADITFTGTVSATVTYTINGGANQITTIGMDGTSIVNTGTLNADVTYDLVSITDGTCSQNLSGSVTISVVTLSFEWVDFKANTEGGNKVHLTWTTALEKNIGYFQVERSNNGKEFEKIGEIIMAKNSSTQNFYETEDNKTISETSYYRIRLTDNDGQSSLSKVQSVIINKQAFNFILYPNPIIKSSTINISTDFSGEYELQVYDMTGKAVIFVKKQGNSQISDINFPSGLYFYVIKAADTTVTGKMIIKD